MRSKVVKHFLEALIISAIPTLLSYLASSELIFLKLIEMEIVGSAIDIPTVQDYCLWIGILFSAVFLSAQLFLVKIRYDRTLEERNLLIRMSKEILSSALGKLCFSNQPNFDVRIFIPKNQFWYNLEKKFHIPNARLKYKIKNIDLIAEQGTTKDLEFEVYPEQEGLVGMCYQSKSMVYDDDLEHNNSTNYNLDENQISRTSNLKWSICCPIFDINNTVVAILALDGKSKITIKEENRIALNENIVAFSRLLYDSVPQLFKR